VKRRMKKIKIPVPSKKISVEEWDKAHEPQCKDGVGDCGHCSIINCPYGKESLHRAWLEVQGFEKPKQK